MMMKMSKEDFIEGEYYIAKKDTWFIEGRGLRLVLDRSRRRPMVLLVALLGHYWSIFTVCFAEVFHEGVIAQVDTAEDGQAGRDLGFIQT